MQKLDHMLTRVHIMGVHTASSSPLGLVLPILSSPPYIYLPSLLSTFSLAPSHGISSIIYSSLFSPLSLPLFITFILSLSLPSPFLHQLPPTFISNSLPYPFLLPYPFCFADPPLFSPIILSPSLYLFTLCLLSPFSTHHRPLI